MTKIKFCGFTNLKDCLQAINLGVDYLGFVVEVPASPRSIGINEFLHISAKLHKIFSSELESSQNFIIENQKNVLPKIVAVVKNPDEALLFKLINSDFPDIIQLHGEEKPQICKAIQNKKEIWKVIEAEPKSIEILTVMEKFLCSVDKFLFDKKKTLQPKSFTAFDIFEQAKKFGKPLLLAGGMNSENVENFLEKLHPFGLDIASGIESSPGKKDFNKMSALITKIRDFKYAENFT